MNAVFRGCWPKFRLAILASLALAAAEGVLPPAVAGAEAAGRPNVVVFLADDAGWGDYSHSGNSQVRTPHIDSLAARGASFDRFFVCPLCAPTRAEFLTGRYYTRTGVKGVSTGYERLNLDERTVAEAFRAAGYATGAFGKWHNGSQWPYHPQARGFNEYYGYTAGHWGEYFDPPLEHNGQSVREQGYIVDLCTRRALAFIERERAHPFFCFIPFTTPHSPWAVPAEYWNRFRDKPITQRATAPGNENLDHTRCALAMLENQDDNVGRVLALLDELSLAENTIVIYFSDNGPNTARWNGRMKGKKGGTDEGSVRSPCFIRWPARIAPQTRVSEIAGAIDLLPTLCSLAGIERVGDKRIDGRDLSALLRGESKAWPPRILFTAWGNQISARSQTHRLDSQGNLYDLRHDEGQTRPLNAQEPELAAELNKAVAQWRAEMQRESAADTERGPKGAGVDPRPFPLGYAEFPRTWLPARDATPSGGIQRSSGAPNCSYFVNWNDKSGTITWNVQVQTTGEYAAEILYTCPPADAGATVELAFGSSRLAGKVTPGWDPPLYTNQDTLPRPNGESPLKEFRPLSLGRLQLEKGTGPLTLRATEIPGAQVMHLRALVLTLIVPPSAQ